MTAPVFTDSGGRPWSIGSTVEVSWYELARSPLAFTRRDSMAKVVAIFPGKSRGEWMIAVEPLPGEPEPRSRVLAPSQVEALDDSGNRPCGIRGGGGA